MKTGTSGFMVIYLLIGVFVALSMKKVSTGESPPLWLFVVSALFWPIVVLATWGK